MAIIQQGLVLMAAGVVAARAVLSCADGRGHGHCVFVSGDLDRRHQVLERRGALRQHSPTGRAEEDAEEGRRR